MGTETSSRPTCLFAVTVFTAFFGVICLVYGLPSLIFGIASAHMEAVHLGASVVGLAATAGAYGLWKVKGWGFNVTALLYVSVIPVSMYGIYLDDSGTNLALQLASIAAAVSVVYYLSSCTARPHK